MKRKYFLRGMGLGIFMTAMLFTIALIFESPSMSEEEIKREAAKLGMVMASDASSKSETSSSASYDQTIVDEVEKSASEAKESEAEAKSEEEAAAEEKSSSEAEKDEANETVKNTTKETDTKKSDSKKSSSESSQSTGESVGFTVNPGENSYTVGAHLFRDGLVDDPASFDSYLEQNGYDNRIQNGDFEIPKGSTYEEIAKILTRE